MYVEEIFVMKQIQNNGRPRYRYRIQGQDIGKPTMNDLEYFRFKYSNNMLPEDIEKVEDIWGTKLEIKDGYRVEQ